MSNEEKNNSIPEGFFRDIVDKENERLKLEALELKKSIENLRLTKRSYYNE